MLSSAPLSKLKLDLGVMALFSVLSLFGLSSPEGVFVITAQSFLPECSTTLFWLPLQAVFVILFPPALLGAAPVLCAISLILPTVKPFCDLYPGQPADSQWRAAPLSSPHPLFCP